MAIKRIFDLSLQRNKHLECIFPNETEQKTISEEPSTSNTNTASMNNTVINHTPNENFSGDMTQDLMRLIGSAIEEWARMYHLENLPKEIIFQQALAALNALNKILESQI